MLIKIDFSSDEAIYQQLCNQIILGIATATLEEGQALPSVRQMADDIGINMHTVNKAYSILRQEGFVKMDRSGCNARTSAAGKRPSQTSGSGQMPQYDKAGAPQDGRQYLR